MERIWNIDWKLYWNYVLLITLNLHSTWSRMQPWYATSLSRSWCYGKWPLSKDDKLTSRHDVIVLFRMWRGCHSGQDFHSVSLKRMNHHMKQLANHRPVSQCSELVPILKCAQRCRGSDRLDSEMQCQNYDPCTTASQLHLAQLRPVNPRSYRFSWHGVKINRNQDRVGIRTGYPNRVSKFSQRAAMGCKSQTYFTTI